MQRQEAWHDGFCWQSQMDGLEWSRYALIPNWNSSLLNHLHPSISVINFADIFNFPGGISQDEAKQKYIDLVNSLVKSAEPTESASVPQVSWRV